MIYFNPNEENETKKIKLFDKFQKVLKFENPIEALLMFNDGFKKALVLSDECITLYEEKGFNKVAISKFNFDSFKGFEKAFIKINLLLHDGSSIKLGMYSNTKQENLALETFENA